MILPAISDYLLAIGSGKVGFDKLSGIEFTADAHGHPVYGTTSRFVEFEARLHGQRCLLCCPTDSSCIARAERQSNALKRIDSPRLAAYRFLRDEMRIRTLSGASRLCDVVVEMVPDGTALDAVLERRLTITEARRMAAEWIDTAEELGRIGFSHRALSPSKIIVCSDGGITLRGLHHGRIETSADDNCAIADITLRILRNALPAIDAPLGSGDSRCSSRQGRVVPNAARNRRRAQKELCPQCVASYCLPQTAERSGFFESRVCRYAQRGSHSIPREWPVWLSGYV